LHLEDRGAVPWQRELAPRLLSAGFSISLRCAQLLVPLAAAKERLLDVSVRRCGEDE
jgi:hypothetical protein